MMRYLLDTDICIYVVNQKPLAVRERFTQMQPGDAGMSIITFCELMFGAHKSQRRADNLAKIAELERLIPAVPLTKDAADYYGQIRADLHQRGALIGSYDLLIAAQAISLHLTLVSSNVREFRRVSGLRVENWAAK
jgi:tRNA(fMet)-specific endonuclease VapC